MYTFKTKKYYNKRNYYKMGHTNNKERVFYLNELKKIKEQPAGVFPMFEFYS